MLERHVMLAPTITQPERDRWFAGTLLRIIAGHADTGGALTVMEQHARQGFSPPLHVHHREDTAILVLDGKLTVLSNDTESLLRAGDFVWLPRDAPHSFRVDSDDAHFLEFATPGGVEGFHVDASEPAAAPGLPDDPTPDIARMLGAVGAYGVDIIGPPMH
jgi:quercetin dioxygenase-like cupin family protein